MKNIILLALAAMPLLATAQVADSSKRLVKLEGGVNFRDLGGYKTTNGKTVKWGKMYRSADISKLTDTDMQKLAASHINTVIDLRETKEAQKAPDRLLPYADYTLCAASEDVGDFMSMLKYTKSGDSLMTSFYGKIDHYEVKYKPMFQKLLDMQDTSALVFHCSAGKDRTGVGAALILTALGVPYKTVENDYLASAVYRKEANKAMTQMMVKQYGLDEKMVNDMMGVKPAYLEASFNAIRKQYGSVDAFFKQVLGLGDAELKQLRAKYTM
ncbi:tyrosine-protein phosphatase [uncultured Chitinophaga sp.]|uniref:tyrosine-protein phosphatase n=1 Tax=uncultured Chitinophaga sp. TaxID=339340 RepID=UPI0025EC7E18|nr:tyrosine-protein phosphatase [uncultured Chitinophaga sp.]